MTNYSSRGPRAAAARRQEIRQYEAESLSQALQQEGPVVEFNGRFYIAMGCSGFNSPANNRSGYASYEKALAAHERYRAKRLAMNSAV